MNKKIIFLDIDGTLVNDDKEIPDVNREALEDARGAGHIIVIASGRVLESVKKQARKLGLVDEGCYVIAFNGAVAVNMHTDEVLYRKAVAAKHIRPLFDEAYKMGLHGHCYADDTVISEKDDEEIRYYSTSLVTPYRVVSDAPQALEIDSCKLLFVDLDGREKLEIFRREITPYCEKNGLDTFFSEAIYLDVVQKGVSKGSAIKFICDMMGIPIKNSIAVGDAENDISMIKAAHIGCAVANAADEVKNCADYITTLDNNNGAVCEVINKFVLQTTLE